MSKTAKVAVSLARETLASLERERRRLRRSRSAIVNEAIDAWLRERTVGAEERRYVEAYLRQPERAGEAAAVAAAVAATWEPWT